ACRRADGTEASLRTRAVDGLLRRQGYACGVVGYVHRLRIRLRPLGRPVPVGDKKRECELWLYQNVAEEMLRMTDSLKIRGVVLSILDVGEHLADDLDQLRRSFAVKLNDLASLRP